MTREVQREDRFPPPPPFPYTITVPPATNAASSSPFPRIVSASGSSSAANADAVWKTSDDGSPDGAATVTDSLPIPLT